MITVELMAIPNHNTTVQVPEGTTIADTLNVAGPVWVELGGTHEIRVDGQLVTRETVLTQDAEVYLSQKVKGNLK